jgi:hypothetical protein
MWGKRYRLTPMHAADPAKAGPLMQIVNNNYPKVKYPGPDFVKDTSIIRNLIFTIQQVTLMQEWLKWMPTMI